MYQLSDSVIKRYTVLEKENLRVPQSVSTVCPFCDTLALFTLYGFMNDQSRRTVSAEAVCPGCSNKIWFWTISPPPNSYPSGQKIKHSPDAFFIYPKPKSPKQPIEGIEKLPEQLAKAYNSAVKVYNSKVWEATATCCRRTLEGLMKISLPSDKQNLTLQRAINELPNHIDLKKPLTDLSHAIREGGNLGAHFDLLREPDEETATIMLELLEYLFDYMYILPKKIEELDKRVSKTTPITPTMTPTP